MTMLNLFLETLRNGVGTPTGFRGGGSVTLETLPQPHSTMETVKEMDHWVMKSWCGVKMLIILCACRADMCGAQPR